MSNDRYIPPASEANPINDNSYYPDEEDIDPVKMLGFPLKLQEMLSRDELSDIISWMPHGRAWKVHKPKAFEEKVIPQFFVCCKYSSFVRQANGWGFRRMSQGADRNAYYHRYFLRGRADLCRLMKRPGVNQKPPIDPSREPNFYSMPDPRDDTTLDALAQRAGSGNRAVREAQLRHESAASGVTIMNAKKDDEDEAIAAMGKLPANHPGADPKLMMHRPPPAIMDTINVNVNDQKKCAVVATTGPSANTATTTVNNGGAANIRSLLYGNNNNVNTQQNQNQQGGGTTTTTTLVQYTDGNGHNNFVQQQQNGAPQPNQFSQYASTTNGAPVVLTAAPPRGQATFLGFLNDSLQQQQTVQQPPVQLFPNNNNLVQASHRIMNPAVAHAHMANDDVALKQVMFASQMQPTVNNVAFNANAPFAANIQQVHAGPPRANNNLYAPAPQFYQQPQSQQQAPQCVMSPVNVTSGAPLQAANGHQLYAAPRAHVQQNHQQPPMNVVSAPGIQAPSQHGHGNGGENHHRQMQGWRVVLRQL